MKALRKIAPHRLQRRQDFLRFDKLRNRQNTEFLTEPGEIPDQRAVDHGPDNVLHKRPVDFDEIKRQFPQIVELVVATAKVIDRKEKSLLSQITEEFAHEAHIADGIALDNFEDNDVRWNLKFRAQLFRLAAQSDKRIVGVRDDSFQVGFGNQVAAFWIGYFARRDRPVDFHEIFD